MPELLSASELSKRQLLLAALRLFSDQGIDAVSMRMINREAGAKNNSALHYHFGNKLGVLVALVAFIQEWFEDAREQALAEVERQDREGDVTIRAIMSAFVSPYLKLLRDEEWGFSAVRFLARMELDGCPEVKTVMNKRAEYAMTRFVKLASHNLPDIPESILKQRFNFAVSSAIQGMASYKALVDSPLGDLSCELESLVHTYTDFCAAGLSAPLGEPKAF